MFRSFGITFQPRRVPQNPIPFDTTAPMSVSMENGLIRIRFPRFNCFRDPQSPVVRLLKAPIPLSLCLDEDFHPDRLIRVDTTGYPRRIGDLFSSLYELEPVFNVLTQYPTVLAELHNLKERLIARLSGFDLSTAEDLFFTGPRLANNYLASMFYLNNFTEELLEEKVTVERCCARLRGFIRSACSLAQVHTDYLFMACGQINNWDKQLYDELKDFSLTRLPAAARVCKSVLDLLPELDDGGDLDLPFNAPVFMTVNNPNARLISLSLKRVEDFNLGLLLTWPTDRFYRFWYLALDIATLVVEKEWGRYREPTVEDIRVHHFDSEILSETGLPQDRALDSFDRDWQVSTIEGNNSPVLRGFTHANDFHPFDLGHILLMHDIHAGPQGPPPPRPQPGQPAQPQPVQPAQPQPDQPQPMMEEESSSESDDSSSGMTSSESDESSSTFSSQTYSAGEHRLREDHN
jgi:hypothetical protein